MKTCAACGRPLASHGGKAAIQSSEIGPEAADASCCGSQATATPDSPKSAQEGKGQTKGPASKPKGTERSGAKQRIRALREFARKKLGHFLPARITLQPRPKVEQTASEAPRPRRRAVQRVRIKRPRAKSEQVTAKPPQPVPTPYPSEGETDAPEQSLQTQAIEVQLKQVAEEPEHAIETLAEQLEPSLPIEASTDVGEQSAQAQTVEARLEQVAEHVIATSAEQIELALHTEVSTDGGEQFPQTQGIETQLEQSNQEPEPVIATPEENIEPESRNEMTSDGPDESSQTQPAEPELDESADDSGTDTTLFQTEELVFVPWRTDEPLEAILPAAETAALKELDETPPPAVQVCNKPEESHTEPSAPAVVRLVDKPAEIPTALETPVEKMAPEARSEVPPAPSVPFSADEPSVITATASKTPTFEEGVSTLPAPLVDVCKPEEIRTEQSSPASAQSNQPLALNQPTENPTTPEAPVEKVAQVYPMIPPAPKAPVPRREEFEASLQSPANPQSKESSVEKKPVELVPGLSADSAAPCEPPINKPAEPDNAACKIEEAVQEAVPTSELPPEQLPIADFPNPVKPEAPAMTTNLEDCVEQTLAPEPEMEVAIDQGGYDNKSEKNLEQPPKKKVLVVDDDPTLRMLLKMGLEPHGYECLLAEHGKAAQAVVQANHPALILVDLLMPVMDGLAFVQWLRETAKDSTPVLVFTNLDDAKIAQQALDSGANAFACKPLRLKELLQTMKELVAA